MVERGSAAAVLTATLILAGGCTSSTGHHRVAETATLRVQAILNSTRPTSHGPTTLNAPLYGYSVRAVGADGSRRESPIDHEGNAVLHLAPGEYVVTTTLAAACVPANVALSDGEGSELRLTCVAP